MLSEAAVGSLHILKCYPELTRGIASCLVVWFQEVRSWRRPLAIRGNEMYGNILTGGKLYILCIEMVHILTDRQYVVNDGISTECLIPFLRANNSREAW